MIVFCQKLMPFVLKVSCSSDWNCNTELHIKQSFDILKNILKKSKTQFIFLWVLNENLPPFSTIINIVSKLVLLYNELKVSVDFNILYCKNEDTVKLVENILSLYEPSRPIKIARNNDEVLRLINRDI